MEDLINKQDLSESDICAKCITPAVIQAGWDEVTQIRREVGFTKGRIIVRGKLVTRGKAKRADYVQYYQHIPLALIEAKDNHHAMGDGMQQALDYAATLEVPIVFSSNGDGFVCHDRTGLSTPLETTLALDRFPTRRSSCSPTTATAAARSRATTSATPSTPPSRSSPRDSSASCW